MHLAVVNLTNGGLSGGYRKYLDQVVPRLARDPRCGRLSVYLPETVGSPVDTGGAVIEHWPVGEHRRGFRWVRERLVAAVPDVILIPTARKLMAGRIPVVTMVRNMEPLRVPFRGNSAVECMKNVARHFAAWRACQGVARVIAVSNHVKDFLTTRWGVPGERIGVVYHGVGDAGDGLGDKLPAVLSGGPPGEFLFTAGSIRPARGLEDALGALPELQRRFPGLRLFVGGVATPDAARYEVRMRGLVRVLGIERSVVWLGALGAGEMAWCFRNCRAFLMTSRAEACPNTLLEAMSHGCGIISTDCPPMPEFAGEGALYYSRESAAQLAARVGEELTDETSSGRRRRTAREIARRFTWDKTAAETIAQLPAER